MNVRAVMWIAGLGALASVSGCDDDPMEPSATGSIEVTTETTGAGTDPDGYEVSVAGVTESVDVDDTVTFDDVETGNRSVTLSDLSANCQVDGDNPVTLTVEEDETADATFEVTCGTP